jgi:glycine cleavage system transcriptional repressor
MTASSVRRAYARAVQLALSAIGRDRPGIVAAVTRILLDHGLNVEDSQMTILRGHFTMTLILAAPEGTDSERLAAELRSPELELEGVFLSEVDEAAPGPEPSHMITVYGADHPGIVHAVASAVAERGIDITDLNTRLLGGDGGESLYVLMMEVALPEPAAAQDLDPALAEVGRREGVEVTLRELERDEL